MAKQIPDTVAAAIAKEGERRTYPWETWTNGKWWHLEQGATKDFDVKPAQFKISAQNWARSHGYFPEVKVTQDGQGVVLRFTEKQD